jgi:ParB-like chromosome segregation protein Spo0J
LILDGRNRWLACERAGIEPWVQEVETDDPDALAGSLNDLS